MGLLDGLTDDPTMSFAMGLLNASGPSARPVSLGQGIAQGYGAMSEAKKARQVAELEALKVAHMRQQMADEAQMKPLQIDQLKAQQAFQNRLNLLLEGAIGGGSTGGTPDANMLARAGMLAAAGGLKGGDTMLKGAEFFKTPTPSFGDQIAAFKVEQDTGVNPLNLSTSKPKVASIDPQALSEIPAHIANLRSQGKTAEANQLEEIYKTQVPQVVAPRKFSDSLPPNAQRELQSKNYEQDRKRLDDMRAAVTAGRSLMPDLERFYELNKDTATGGIIDRLSFIPTLDDNKREMESIAARLAPRQKPTGAGSTSDKDIALYLSGLPGPDKTGPTNRAIRLQYESDLAEAKQRLAFAEKYLEQNGSLSGYETAYDAEYPKEKGRNGRQSSIGSGGWSATVIPSNK